MSQQIKTPDEELAIALERCLNRWKGRPLTSITGNLVREGELLLAGFGELQEFSDNQRTRVKQLVDLSNTKIIQS
jgi:hypothetical protein